MKRVNQEKVVQIHGYNTDLTSDTQLRVPVTGQKYHRSRHRKILDVYDNISIYVVVGSLKANTDFVHLYVIRRMITLESGRVVSGIYHNNKKTILLSTLFVPYLPKSYEQLWSQIEQLQ